MIRLLVIEDSSVTISGIKGFFRSRDDISVTLQAYNIEEALAQGDPELFDIILLDLWLNSTDPALPESNVQRLRERYPGKPIVVFTSEDSTVWERRMKEAGARGYIRKTARRKEMKAALESVMKGSTVFSITTDTFTEGVGYIHPSVPKSNALTAHQQKLLTLLANGSTQEEMAAELLISKSAIEKGLAHLRQKFGVKTNTALIRFVTFHKLI